MEVPRSCLPTHAYVTWETDVAILKKRQAHSASGMCRNVLVYKTLVVACNNQAAAAAVCNKTKDAVPPLGEQWFNQCSSVISRAVVRKTASNSNDVNGVYFGSNAVSTS